ncbi:peptide-N(4)-(N-acetyl-beta-glucosaminyl)asparagine amidase isoform X1 [Corythoichthys intestinalis]|uniref:peptide-N(4)-(N-acetyl-beta- glucosaminyl)asparagine amidase isoform X1 n=2 Tax=Corythoichthys intestinalis TaxID=161448 RepID=UPI0025A57CC3|nr:peptide-N(4)-(N-acetyl-beta-glucosaminyl)asparagine amidase isoform X1 [Corythoichthys intestinalis]
MALSAAVRILCENSNEIFFDVCKVLLSYADDILRHPNVEKYRSIHIDSPTFSGKLLPINGAVECLFEMGFVEADTHLVFPKSASLYQLKIIRESIAAQRAQRLGGGQHDHLSTEATAERQTSSDSSLLDNPSSQSNSKDFFVTLQSNFQRVLLYENPELQQKARTCIPYKQLSSAAEQKLKLAKEAVTACKLGKEDFLVLELLRWFKNEFFSWVDCLPCSQCSGPTQNTGSLSPTVNDLRWGATRVENHYCETCQLSTRFPRYNNPEKLLTTRKGRCGEWANCFTLCCRAVGLEARYIWDSTDHVWTEIYSVSQRRWLHCDSCENVCDKPLLYELGWGKELSYIMAFSRDQVVDVTWRYSCKHQEVMSRRTSVHETLLLHAIIGLNALRQRSLSVERKGELNKRLLIELVEFISPKKPKEGELGGRISGSLDWKIARGEAGGSNSQGAGYVFTPTDKERRDKFMHVLYNATKDQYCRISNDFKVIPSWDRCVWRKESVFRKVENDWEMVYIARTEGSCTGQISWKFNFAPAQLSVQSVSIRACTQTFNCGEVNWLLQSDTITTNFIGDGSMKSFKCLNGCHEFTVTALLSGGEGNASWQHSQLFRQSLKEKEQSSFEILIHLKDT